MRGSSTDREGRWALEIICCLLCARTNGKGGAMNHRSQNRGLARQIRWKPDARSHPCSRKTTVHGPRVTNLSCSTALPLMAMGMQITVNGMTLELPAGCTV